MNEHEGFQSEAIGDFETGLKMGSRESIDREEPQGERAFTRLAEELNGKELKELASYMSALSARQAELMASELNLAGLGIDNLHFVKPDEQQEVIKALSDIHEGQDAAQRVPIHKRLSELLG